MFSTIFLIGCIIAVLGIIYVIYKKEIVERGSSKKRFALIMIIPTAMLVSLIYVLLFTTPL